jgi:ribosome recycling factor
MSQDPQYKEYEDRMNKTINALTAEYATIRAGRANPAILDKIRVDYYGAPTPIGQIAAIAVPEARTLTIQPWDISTLKLIEKAIQASDIGINPQNDGRIIRLIFPPLTEERRKEYVKAVHRHAEDGKIAIRAVRRDAIEEFKNLKKKSLITEDDLKDAEKIIQELTDKYCKNIDALTEKKTNEILNI